ncbi:helix-turn-helix domain-containing protein [Sporosarcina gallistercoris]|uniref:Helix-turn-helix domain-containing protein n=1 Tax=Sporosarcina gallistercoris TaxID=2762245 RepID=A0ABR8PMH6_9BACL|nr:helix-turn-helix domain-containing protein [Sporosarcina gallistercoris]MBD7909381.1 helix-turn-helix domain-containing protein [Sporosarcina gallistercoris]
MTSSIEILLTRIGITVPYSLWIAKDEQQHVYPLVNPNGMTPPKMKKSSGKPIQVIQEEARSVVQFTYSQEYRVILLLEGSAVLDEIELGLIFDLLYKGYSEYADETGRAKLARIVDSIHYTTASLDLDDVFSNILTHTLDVITNADYGTLWLFDEARGKIICKASEGYRFEEIQQMEFDLGEGPVGHAFAVGHPVLITDPRNIENDNVKRISKENKQRWGRRVEDITNVRSVIAYPIGVDGRIECVMYLGQMNSEQVLTDRDLWLLQIFTAQVGIAIRNAKQFAYIRDLNEKLVQRDAIHATLTNLSVRNMGTEKMVEELSRMAGQPLVFADLLMNEMIPSSASLPQGVSFTNLLERIQLEGKAKSFELTSAEDVILYPIRSGSVVLGCLIAHSSQKLGRLSELAIEQGSVLLALERVQKQNVLAFYYKNQRELFEELVHANDPSILNEKVEALGIRNVGGFAVAMLQVTDCSDPQELEAHIFRVIAELRSSAIGLIQTVFGWQNKVIVLAGVTGPSELTLFERKLEELLIHRSDLKTDSRLHGGIGSLIHATSQIEQTYREAEIALTNPLAGHRNNQLVRYTDIGISRLFTSRNTEEVSKFLTDIFDPLREADRSDGTLEQTLLAYFACNRSTGEAANILHIHINTLYQRLKKIEETLGLSLKNTDDALQLQLACYLRQRA